MSTTELVCPRCRSTNISQVAASPVPGRWLMYSCTTCWYGWRSTESQENSSAEFYPEEFRLDPKDFSSAPRTV